MTPFQTQRLKSLSAAVRIEALLELFVEPPLELRELGHPDHVGMLATVWTEVYEPLRVQGFLFVEMFASRVVARELGVPTHLSRWHDPVNGRSFEVFVPNAPAAVVREWIREGRALHLAYNSPTLLPPPGWTPVSIEPARAVDRTLLYLHRSDRLCRLELWR